MIWTILAALGASLAALAGLVVLTWVGQRDGDLAADIRVAVEIDPMGGPAGTTGARLVLVNPCSRPVVVAIRTRALPALSQWLAIPYAARTKLLPSGIPPSDAVIEVLPSCSTRQIELRFDHPSCRGFRVDTIAYEWPGRVRLLSRLCR